jgi:hypothetical protein
MSVLLHLQQRPPPRSRLWCSYFYIVFMSILLVSRIERDAGRCSAKYGQQWQECAALFQPCFIFVFK